MSRLLESLRVKAKLLQKAKKKSNPDFKLKDAYEVLARTAGYASWREWKDILTEHEHYAPPGAALWHVWYADYEKALVHLRQVDDVYLIPFQKHFFICDSHYIKFLGLELEDPDLHKVGRNWSEPQDRDSWQRILSKLSSAKKNR